MEKGVLLMGSVQVLRSSLSDPSSSESRRKSGLGPRERSSFSAAAFLCSTGGSTDVLRTIGRPEHPYRESEKIKDVEM